MSTENYDNDCKFIKEDDENYLVEKINTKHIYGIQKNQYPLVFLKKLYKLLIEDIIDEEDTDTSYIKQIGNYYKGKEDYDNMKKYYLLAIEKGDAGAMNNLANYYNNEKDYDNMLKYYKLAIEKGDISAIKNLSNYYKNIKDYDNMEKYYLMLVEEGDITTMNNLGTYYNEIKDYNNMKKYYSLAIDKGNSDSMYSLGLYYKKDKDYDMMKKYYSLAIEKGNSNAMYSLGLYYKQQKDYDNMKKYYLMAIEKGHTGAKNDLNNFKDKEHIHILTHDIIKQFITLTNNCMNEKEATAIIILLVNNIGFIINKDITHLFEDSDKNTLLALQVLNKYANDNKISSDDVKIIFNEHLNKIKKDTTNYKINKQQIILNYESDLIILLKKEEEKEQLKKRLELNKKKKIQEEKETAILINENLNYLKSMANCVKSSNWTELNKHKARRDYFMTILERDYPNVVDKLTRLPNVDFSSGCSQYEIQPQKVFMIDGKFKFTYMYDDALNNLSV